MTKLIPLLLLLAGSVSAQRLFNITKNCPIDISLYHQGTLRKTLCAQGTRANRALYKSAKSMNVVDILTQACNVRENLLG